MTRRPSHTSRFIVMLVGLVVGFGGRIAGRRSRAATQSTPATGTTAGSCARSTRVLVTCAIRRARPLSTGRRLDSNECRASRAYAARREQRALRVPMASRTIRSCQPRVRPRTTPSGRRTWSSERHAPDRTVRNRLRSSNLDPSEAVRDRRRAGRALRALRDGRPERHGDRIRSLCRPAVRREVSEPMRNLLRRPVVAAVVLVATGMAAGVAWATIPDGERHDPRLASDKSLRVVDSGNCSTGRGYRELGPECDPESQGSRGPSGPTGNAGQQGLPGVAFATTVEVDASEDPVIGGFFKELTCPSGTKALQGRERG